jgi:hypothetical protein
MSDSGDCGGRGGVVVKALRYKPAGRGFDSAATTTPGRGMDACKHGILRNPHT